MYWPLGPVSSWCTGPSGQFSLDLLALRVSLVLMYWLKWHFLGKTLDKWRFFQKKLKQKKFKKILGTPRGERGALYRGDWGAGRKVILLPGGRGAKSVRGAPLSYTGPDRPKNGVYQKVIKFYSIPIWNRWSGWFHFCRPFLAHRIVVHQKYQSGQPAYNLTLK